MSTRHTVQSKNVKTRPQRGARKARRKEPKMVEAVKAPSRRKRKEATAPATRHGVRGERKPTKTQLCLELLGRPAGAGIAELQAATGWQAHSVRGFLAGTVKKKLGLVLHSEQSADGSRRYRVGPVEG
jgi:hypothetical protein